MMEQNVLLQLMSLRIPVCVVQDPVRLQLLAGLLLCSEQCVCRMARKYPELLNTDPTEVTQRLMLLKVSNKICMAIIAV